MNSIDIILLVVIGFFCIKGLFRGMIIEVFTLVGVLVGYVIALREMSTLAIWLRKSFHLPELVSSTLSFLVIFILILLLFRWIASVLRHLMRWTFIGWVDRGGGMIFGVFKGTLIASLLLLLITLIPRPRKIQEVEEESLLYQPVRSVAPAVFNFLKHTFPKTKDFYEEVKEGFSEKSKDIVDNMKEKRLKSLQKELEDGIKKEE